MPLIASIDGPNRDIYLSADTVGAEINPIDLYREMRTLRRTTEELRKYNLFLQAKGYDQKAPGKFTERYVICLEGTRIIPFNISHTLTVTGTIITDDGQEGVSCFDRTPLSSTTVVDINYVPPQVEVITVNTAGGSGGDVTNVNEIANAVAAKFLFNIDGHVLSEAVGVSTEASIDEKTLNRVVQGAIPPPPSNGAIAEEIVRILGKPKLYDREFKAIEQRLIKLAKPAPANNDAAEIKQMLRMMMAQIDKPETNDDQALMDEMQKLYAMLDQLPKEIPQPKDYMGQFSKIIQQVEQTGKVVRDEAKLTRMAIKEIPQPDLSALATADELAALTSLAKKLNNYDDADLRSSINTLINGLVSDVERIDRKADLILDNQYETL